MKIQVQTKYVVFPVNRLAVKKRFVFSEGGTEVYALNINYDDKNPTFFAYIDLSRFMGKTLDLTVEPDLLPTCRFTDALDLPDLYREPTRPQIHFTSKNGWMNDPNGLIYHRGKYHLFFQHNPALNEWENMHWGHATSTDLLHWEETDEAMFPDKNGTVYSGSAVLPDKVKGGILSGAEGFCLFHTRTSPYAQWLAVSNADGTDFQIVGDKPVLPFIIDMNRDPKVVFCDELDAYVMAIFLTEDRYLLLRSDNLTDWEKLQEVSLPGDRECPDIFSLISEDGRKKWILAGAADRYRIGEVKDGKFVFSDVTKRFGFSRGGYAGQTFSGLPDGRVIRMAWERYYFPHTERFYGQMSLPLELTLHGKGDDEEIRVAPISGISSLIQSEDKYADFSLSADKATVLPLGDCPVAVELTGVPLKTGKLTTGLYGRFLTLDFAANTVSMGDAVMPLSKSGTPFALTVIVDRRGYECFNGTNGYFSLSEDNLLPDRTLPSLVLRADGDMTLTVSVAHLESTLPKN